MTQEEIDALAAGMGGKVAGTDAPAASMGGKVADIDALAANMGGTGAAPPPSIGQVAMEAVQGIPHNLGVAARGAIEGVSSIATIPGDAVTYLLNLILPDHLKQLPPSQGLSLILTQAGVPNAETQAEMILKAASGGLAGAGGTALLGSAIKSAPGVVGGIGRSMAANPASQIIGSGLSNAAQEGAKQAGAPLPVQIAAGLGAGVTFGAAGGALDVPAVATIADMADDIAAASLRIGTLVRKAAKGNASARRQLAEMAAINPDAKAAAERLGIELPTDVFSDNPQIRSAAGITRALPNSDASAAWKTTVANAVNRADEVIQSFDAIFVEGVPSPGVVSDRVRNSVMETRDALKAEAGAIYDEIRNIVPLKTPVNTNNVRAFLEKRIEDLGGVENLTSVEKKLYALITGKTKPTYGFWQDEKQRLGTDVFAKTDPYPDAADMVKRDIYEAITKDQTETIGSAGSAELQKRMAQANLLWAKKKQLDGRLVDAYGPELMGSIANKMRTAMVDSSKGGALAFNQLMETVPAELRKEVVATALASVTRSGRGIEAGAFGLSEWAKMYPSLRANAPVYKKIVDILGPQSDGIMRDLYEVSRVIVRARALVDSDAGRDAALLGAMTADNVIQKIMDNVITRAAVTSAGATTGGPVGAAVMSVVTNAIANGGKNRLVKAGDLFRSPKFQKLMEELGSTGKAGEGTINGVVNSAEFTEFARYAGIEDRLKWLLGAINTRSSEEGR